MRALYYSDWDRLEIRTVDEPRPRSGEVLIRVAACGVCGSEIESVVHHSRRRTPPLILGHEFCGTVEEVGGEVDDGRIAIGSRVVANAVLSCGRCEECETGRANLCVHRAVFGMHRQGAFAEYVTAPASALFEWPDTVEATAACLAEPLGNGVHVARLVSRLNPGRVLIIGAGSIGLMCLQAIRNQFPDAYCLVTDLDDRRLEIAGLLGADAVSYPDREDIAKRFAASCGRSEADVVVDAAGVAASKRLSLQACGPGGTAVWIGLGENTVELDTYQITLGERSVMGSYGATASDMREALRLMSSGHVDVSSWVTTYEPENWVEGFTSQLALETRDVKAVLTH